MACSFSFSSPETATSAKYPDFNSLIGKWIRPDGGYIVRLMDINPDGSVDAKYYNPNEIHIAEANVSLWKGLVKLYIKLEDKGIRDPSIRYTIMLKKTRWRASIIKPSKGRRMKWSF